MRCAVFARNGLAGKISHSSRLEPPNEILGCAQNQTAGLAFKEIGPYLKLIVADIITTPTGKRTEVELGSINSLRVTGFDVPVVDLDLSAWMQFVEPSTRKTERVIVSFMIGEKIGAERLNSFLDLGPMTVESMR